VGTELRLSEWLPGRRVLGVEVRLSEWLPGRRLQRGFLSVRLSLRDDCHSILAGTLTNKGLLNSVVARAGSLNSDSELGCRRGAGSLVQAQYESENASQSFIA
jgi:hypothetical protein